MKFFKRNIPQLKNNYRRSEEGFTLVEMIVAMAIVSALSVFTVANVKIGRDEQALLRSAQTFAFNLKKMQNLALSPKKYGADPVCFYGVDVVNNSSYRLYYRDSNNCAGLAGAQYRFNGQATELELIFLEAGVQFLPPTNHDFAFIPPEPIALYRANANFADTPVVLNLGGGAGGSTRTVTVNKFGNVEIQ